MCEFFQVIIHLEFGQILRRDGAIEKTRIALAWKVYEHTKEVFQRPSPERLAEELIDIWRRFPADRFAAWMDNLENHYNATLAQIDPRIALTIEAGDEERVRELEEQRVNPGLKARDCVG